MPLSLQQKGGDLYMTQHFLSFEPTTGLYEQAIRPHKKWSEYTDMSPRIEIDGKDYRLIRVAGKIFKSATKNIFLCDPTGNIIEDRQLYRKGLSVYYLLNKLNAKKEELISSKDETVTFGLKSMHKGFQELAESLCDELTEAENIALREQIDYFEKSINLSVNIEEEAEVLLSFIEQLEENKIDRLTVALIDQWNHHLFQLERNNIRMELLTIENGMTIRPAIKEIVYNASNFAKFPDQDFHEIITEYFDGIDEIEEGYLENGKQDWGQMVAIDPNKGEFHLETYLKEAWEGTYIKSISENHQNEVLEELLEYLEK